MAETHNVTVNGVSVAIDVSKFGDIRVIRDFGKAREGDLFAMARFCERLLGDGFDGVVDSLTVDGDCPVGTVWAFCLEAIAEAAKAKGADVKN